MSPGQGKGAGKDPLTWRRGRLSESSPGGCLTRYNSDATALSVFASGAGDSLFAVSSDGQRDTLWQMSPDGSNRRQVWTAAPGENLTGAVAGDGQALYLTVRVLGRQMGDTCRELRCIELAAGHVRTLITLPDTAWLMGAGAGKLLVLCHGDGTDTWLSCNPTDGTAAELYQYANDYGPAAPTAVPDGYTLWLFAPGKGNRCHLIHRDLITGQETEFQDGTHYATTVEIPDLALIEQQDYLDGAPNWLPLEEETGAS